MILTPWRLFLVAIAGWMNRQQQEVIAYLRTENQVLREKLGKKRIILNDSQKQRLATAAMKLGKDLLRQWGTLFSPETILRWNRWFIARKYDGSGKRGPAPKKANSVRKLVLEMAEASPSWGYGRIYGELRKLGYDVHWQTVRRIMLDAGLLPDPDKPYKTTWKTFLKSHWESLAACDFFTLEAWGLKGLTRYMVFFVIDLATWRVQIAYSRPATFVRLPYGRNSRPLRAWQEMLFGCRARGADRLRCSCQVITVLQRFGRRAVPEKPRSVRGRSLRRSLQRDDGQMLAAVVPGDDEFELRTRTTPHLRRRRSTA